MTSSNQEKMDVATLEAQLWRPNEQGETPVIFAILDGARDKKIEALVRKGALKSSCLYEGKLSYAMAIVAPYIVELERGHAQTHAILSQGWGNSWGVFAVTYPPTSMLSVRRNCRKIAKVKSPEGKTLIFRYYDPRVLRVYLPNSNRQEAQKVFGPTTAFIVESAQGATLHRFCQTEQGVADVQENKEASKRVVEHQPTDVHINQTFERSDDLKISPQQIAAFEKIRLTAFTKDMVAHLKNTFTHQVQQFSDDQALFSWTSQNIYHALEIGFETEQEICRYLNVAIVQGQDIKDAQWLKDIMAKPLNTSTKAALIEKKSLELLDEEHEHVKQQIADLDNSLLRQFYDTQKDKIHHFGIPLYGLQLSTEAEIKAWMYRVGQACLNLGLTDELALDIWLDIAMHYGEHFHKEPWAQLTPEQKQLMPSQILKHLLAQQPHNHSAQNA